MDERAERNHHVRYVNERAIETADVRVYTHIDIAAKVDGQYAGGGNRTED